MDDLNNDIERYRRGELSPAEMHRLEKKALSDPFLADALEGAESVNAENFSADVRDLREGRIASRKTKMARLSSWRIAASVAFILISVGVLYTLLKRKEPVTLAKQESKILPLPVKKNQRPDTSLITPATKSKTNLLSLNRPPTALPSTPGDQKADSKSMNQAGQLQSVSRDILTDDKNTKPDEGMAKEKNMSAGRAAELKAEAAGPDKSLSSGAPLGIHKKIKPGVRIIHGAVRSAGDQAAIKGVNITIKGTTMGTLTDTRGNYQITLEDSSRLLVYSFIGFRTSEVNVKDQSTMDVQLFADSTAYSEIAVTDYGLVKDDEPPGYPTLQLAEPSGGKKLFDQYLQNNKRHPSGAVQKKTGGKVTLEFIIKNDGTLSDFTVIQGTGAGGNEEVIRLIKEGPKWLPNRQQNVPQDSKVRIQVRIAPSR
jgi:mRNA-degrading endonuclease toxin of MazEF toxin-antitoxin module